MTATYLGRWQWNIDEMGGYWAPPKGCLSALDLRSLPQCGLKEKAKGCLSALDLRSLPQCGLKEKAEGYGVFTMPEADSKAGILFDSKSAADLIGKRIEGIEPDDILWELLTKHADPTGQTFAKPLKPDHKGRMKLRNRIEAFDPAKFALTVALEQEDYRSIRANCLTKDSNLYLKYLGALELKYKLPGETFIPADLPSEKSIVPSTTITDNFNRSDADALGSSSEGWSWTEVSGDTDIVSNKASCTTDPTIIRAEKDLSSDDHYCQFDIAIAGSYRYSGLAARMHSSDLTWYHLWIRRSEGVWIRKVVAGVATNLGSVIASSVAGYSTWSSAFGDATFRLTCDGSTLTAYFKGTQIRQETDTDITGNVRCGGHRTDYGGSVATWDNFEAADLVAGGGGSPIPVLLHLGRMARY